MADLMARLSECEQERDDLCRMVRTPLRYMHKLKTDSDPEYAGSSLEADVKKALAKVGAGGTAVQGDMLLPANAEVTGA